MEKKGKSAFEEFSEATQPQSSEHQDPKPQPPKLPADPPKAPTEPPKGRVDYVPPEPPKSAQAESKKGWLGILLALLMGGSGGYFVGDNGDVIRVEPPKKVMVANKCPKETTSVNEIKKLKGANRWLRHLLRQEKRKGKAGRIGLENLATCRERLRRLTVSGPRSSMRERIYEGHVREYLQALGIN